MDTSGTAATPPATPTWSWTSAGRSTTVVTTIALVGVVLLGGGLLVLSTMDKESTGGGIGIVAAAVGLVLEVLAFGLWFGRESLVLRGDGVLEYWRRKRRTRELDVGACDEVALVRSSIRKQIMNSDGHSSNKTVHYLSIVPASDADGRRDGQRPPSHWLSSTTFPRSRDAELRAALEQFATVQVVG